MSDKTKYLLVAVLSFLAGFIYFNKRKTKTVDSDFNKTLAIQKNGKYFLVFNSVVVLSREICKDQYDKFLIQYPSGKVSNNVLDLFSTPNDRYTFQDGKYYEYKWDGSKYSNALEITKEEYEFLSKKNFCPQNINI